MISLLCPTRKRPERFSKMVWSALETATNRVEILFYVSDDDDSYDQQAILLPTKVEMSEVKLKVVRGPRVTFSNLWNQMLPRATGDIFMLCADDVIFRTYRWDEIVEQAYAKCPDKILCCYGDDGSPNGKNFATLPFISRRWTEVLGQFTPDGYTSDFCDAHVQDIADMIGRKKLLPILTEHCHWLWSKAEKDETYRENEMRNRKDNNTQRYRERLPERLADAEKLRQEIARCAARS